MRPRSWLDAPGAEHEMMVAGARRNPDRVHEWAGGAVGRYIKVIIAVAGKSAHFVRCAGW